MNQEFVQCSYCRSKVPLERCEFAGHRAVLDGKEYIFCCVQCAKQFKARKRKQK